MKKINLLTIAILFATAMSSFAQTSKGTLFVGGGLGFTSSSGKFTTTLGGTTIESDGVKSTTFSIVPGVGYFVADKLAVGLDLSVNSSSVQVPDNNDPDDYEKTSGTSFGFTPYVRKYWMVGDNFGFTGTFGAGVAFGSSKIEEKNGNTTVTNDGPKTTDLEIGITPGIVFFPTSKVGLEANFGFVGFSSTTSKTDLGNGNESKFTNSTFGLSANSIRPSFSLGFRYYLTK
ncbi:hypothetical protein AD998_01140 [bacterium 336/3]|nr:hypothetical protein AD998_01140 [bacterium 336/3]